MLCSQQAAARTASSAHSAATAATRAVPWLASSHASAVRQQPEGSSAKEQSRCGRVVMLGSARAVVYRAAPLQVACVPDADPERQPDLHPACVARANASMW